MKETTIKQIFAAFFIFIFAIATYADAQSDSYESLRAQYDQLRLEGKAVRNKYMNIGNRFYKLYTAAPNADYADSALAFAGRAYKLSYEHYLQDADYDIAQKYFRTLYSNYTGSTAADAYLESAELYILKRDLPSARLNLERLKQKFPGTLQEVAANQMLADLQRMDRGGATVVNNSYVTPPEVLGVVSDTPVVIEPPSGTMDIAAAPMTLAAAQNVDIPAGTAAIKAIRFFSAEEYTRVVIDLSKNAEFNKHWLKENPEINMPPRLYVEINDSTVENGVPQNIPIKDGLVNSVRWAYNRPGVTRVVLDSQSIESFTVFQMSNPARIVIDVSNVMGIGGADIDEPVVTPQPPVVNPDPINPNTTVNPCLFGLTVKTIVLDPGHGGKDPGCNYFGMKEKDIVLEVARELRALIKKTNPNIKVILTRETDVFIPLEERTAIANKNKADLFISIHVNATKNGQASGVETYFLNTTNDKSALEVAAFENQASSKAISDLQGILVDLMSNSKRKESAKLAGFAQSQMAADMKLSAKQNHGVKSAPFYVLVGATMPAVLVETGFLSNKADADKLKTSAHRKLIAKGIHDGIFDYIKNICG
ncbi:MAG: N-acetylmuramoyl-L-alanine amidase [Deferribacteraceae bacterium]|jgi:N-acetylmuramoyl-L-alanine amidase|nr:N-acetylmuramoyl-L-alanine amidase [Deferribacteraceae bacterium]